MDRENQNAPSTVDEILRQMEEKTDAGEYIYRGESKHFEIVSSNLYRVFLQHKDFDVETEQFDIEIVQKGMLEDAKKYLRRTSTDCELLVEMQHYGQQELLPTSLIWINQFQDQKGAGRTSIAV